MNARRIFIQMFLALILAGIVWAQALGAYALMQLDPRLITTSNASVAAFILIMNILCDIYFAVRTIKRA